MCHEEDGPALVLAAGLSAIAIPAAYAHDDDYDTLSEWNDIQRDAEPVLLSSDALGAVFGDGLEDVKAFEFGMAQIERSVVSGAGVRFSKLL